MTVQQQRYRKISAIVGVAGISLGAFGAHGLEGQITPEMMDVYQTGVLYHLIHAVTLLALVIAPESLWAGKSASRVAICWIGGIVLFSGSLYVLAVTEVGVLGAITPFGGVLFIAGWAFVFGLRPTEKAVD